MMIEAVVHSALINDRGWPMGGGEEIRFSSASKQKKSLSSRIDAELVRYIKAMVKGEEQALAAFYDRTSRQVYGLVFHILKDAIVAEEVTLDVYLQVWREAASYQVERGNPLSWLIVLARSRALDRLRTVKTERRHMDRGVPVEEDILAEDALPDEQAIDADHARCVRAALAQLPIEQRHVLVMAYFEGLNHGEIAERLALPLGTVKTRIRTGMLRLQELLKSRLSLFSD